MTIGFSDDIDLTGRGRGGVLRSQSRKQVGWYAAVVKRKIATKTRGVCTRLLRGRALSATRAGIYLNLKLGNRSQAASPPFPSIWPSSLFFSLFLPLPFLSSLFFSYRLFASFLLCYQTTLPRGFLTPLIPASCRSSLRPARPSKNSLTCLGGLFPLSPFSLLFHWYPVCTNGAKRHSMGNPPPPPSVLREKYWKVVKLRGANKKRVLIFGTHLYTNMRNRMLLWKKSSILFQRENEPYFKDLSSNIHFYFSIFPFFSVSIMLKYNNRNCLKNSHMRPVSTKNGQKSTFWVNPISRIHPWGTLNRLLNKLIIFLHYKRDSA